MKFRDCFTTIAILLATVISLKFQEHMDKQRLSIVDFFVLVKYWKDAFTEELLRNSWGLGQRSCVSGV